MNARTHVALVAGSGMIAALAQIENLLAGTPGDRVLVFYGNRTAGQVQGLESLQALKDRYLERLSLFFLFSADPQEVQLLNGELDAAKLRELAGVLFDAGAVDEFWLAGPNGAIAEFSGALAALGVPSTRVRALGDAGTAKAGGAAIHSTDSTLDSAMGSAMDLTTGSTAAASAAPVADSSALETSRASLSPAPAQPGASPKGAVPATTPAPPEQTSSGEVAARTAAREDVTEVTVNMDGRRRQFTMARAGATVLEAAEEAGLDLPFSCRAGVCSTCRTKVVKGAVEMMQNYALEPWEVEEGYILACQSHPTTAELELDYDDK